ncbi:hypothetical protein [Georgenia sp. SYP-B2076]|uniref:hypothetical protein n=1 Tax=Georgenia sp. SYP-B2076 TaxID=2495881 RepID=UPI0013DFD494|nr:hypothetical protein [Georgenia sp. SYP-B2076]
MRSQRGGFPWRTVPVALAVMISLVALASAPAAHAQTGAEPQAEMEAEMQAEAKSMRLFISPHPDDEMEGWAAVDEVRPSAYTVFITLTHGEATGYCQPAVLAVSLQADLGERPPNPTPAGKFSPTCAQARIDSWLAFHDGAAAVTSSAKIGAAAGTTLTLGPVPGLPQPTNPHASIGATRAQAWIGPRGARLALDLGDGNLTTAEVQWAIKAVLALRGGALPNLPLSTMIAASYVNKADDGAIPYAHPDHIAETDAVKSLAGLAGDGGVWIATSPYDDRADEAFTLSKSDYKVLMGVSSTLQKRKGAHQVAFGWLTRGYWPTGKLPLAETEVIFPRQATFRYVSNPGSAGQPPA